MHPVLLRIGTFEIHSYKVILTISILASIWVSLREAKHVGIPVRQMLDYLTMNGSRLAATGPRKQCSTTFTCQ